MARLEKLMHSMLRLARAEQWAAGSTRRDLEAVEVAATCESALERLAPVARERGVTIDFVSNGAMPMRADADDLELVWSNLLENAIRFSPAGGQRAPSRTIATAREVMSRSKIAVREFRRPNWHICSSAFIAATARARATPAGTAWVSPSRRALIEAYGGTITPESGPGQGTRMVVEVPLENSAAGS